MVNTVVFDIGNVLAPFNWQEVFADIFDAETAEIVGRATVLDLELWNELDRGHMTDEELFSRFYDNAPGYKSHIDFGIWEIYRRMRPYPYAAEWVKSLKEKGLKVYLLSNFGKTPFEMAKEHYGFMEHVDGGIISYEIKDLKPNPSIFMSLCSKYGFSPENAVFIDDNAANVEAAGKLGFKTVLFTDYNEAKERINKLTENGEL